MLFSKRSHEGWLMIDDRLSGGRMFEGAVITCAHCQTQVVRNPERERPRSYCRKCDHYICDNPACNSECHPFKKLADDVLEAADRGRHDLIEQLRRDVLRG